MDFIESERFNDELKVPVLLFRYVQELTVKLSLSA